MILRIGRMAIPVESLAEASAIYCRLRDESYEGSSDWPSGKIGTLRVSYNGRIWDGDVIVFDPSRSE